MQKTEKILKSNDNLILSITNREIKGTIYNGCGVEVKGIGKISTTGEYFEIIKKEYEWSRAVLIVDIREVNQVL